MPKIKFTSVDDYIAAQPAPARAILERVRTAIRSAVPEFEETISYNIPAYRIDGRSVLFFAGWKKHYSLYPASEALIAKFKDDLAPFEIEKGTIRFPLSTPVPAKLIGRIAKFRAHEIAKSQQ